MSDSWRLKPLWPFFHCGDALVIFPHTLLPQVCALVHAASLIAPSAMLTSMEHSKSGKRCLCGLYISVTQLTVSNLCFLNLKNIVHSSHWETKIKYFSLPHNVGPGKRKNKLSAQPLGFSPRCTALWLFWTTVWMETLQQGSGMAYGLMDLNWLITNARYFS